jgi:titin
MGDEGVFGSPFELLYDGTNRPELLTVNLTDLMTSLTYTFKLFAHNAIYQSLESSDIIVKIGLPPGQPSQPFDLYQEYTGSSITVGWEAPLSDGGWPITSYLIWVDDGAGNWPTDPISVTSLTFKKVGLTDSLTYGFYVQAVNDIGTSVSSNTQYFVCATVPSEPSAPVLEAATDSSITASWNMPTSSGGSPITGYRLYINALEEGDWKLAYDGDNQPTVLVYQVLNLERGMSYRF